jgi:hypothetical protein
MAGPEFPAGSTVVLKSLPPGFLEDLPEEDKTAILAVFGDPPTVGMTTPAGARTRRLKPVAS